METLAGTILILWCCISFIENHEELNDVSWNPYHFTRNHRRNHYTKDEVENYPEVPFAGSDDARINLANLAQIKGSFYLHDVQKESGLGVYKLKLFEDRVILADPIAIQVMYDNKLTAKSTDAGLVTVNGLNLKGYLSSASTNGFQKILKKRGMWKILRRAEKKYGNEGLFGLLKKHWLSVLPSIKSNETNVENLIDVVTVRTLTEFFFDKPFDLDLKIFFIWFSKGITPKSVPELQLDDLGQHVTDQMYAYIDSTPWAKTVLPKLAKRDDRSEETLKSEALFFAFIFSAFGLRNGLSSSIPLFLNLDTRTKGKILREVEIFHENDGNGIDEKLSAFDVVERFTIELFRFSPPVTQVFGRAKKDFLLDSLQGRYKVKKGAYMTGYSYGAQRDPDTFRLPELFSITGRQDYIKNNFVAFGGPFNQKARVNNRKCLGQSLSLNIVKMFVTLFAKCEIDPVTSIRFTQSTANRVVASDEPLKVNKFIC